MIAHTSRSTYLVTCALILIGALVACAPAPTPVARPTLTLIAPTATITPPPTSPIQPTPTIPTRVPILQTAEPTALRAVLETTITPNPDFTTQIIDSLARELAIPANRIQLASVDAGRWLNSTLGCMPGDTRSNDERLQLVDGYQYRLLVGDTVYEIRSIGDERFIRCPQISPAVDDLLLAVDPVAADLLRLVQQRVASEYDISTRHVQLIAIEPVRWTDSSLGCPIDGQAYETVDIDGYRIEVSAGETRFIFHSDSLAVYLCTSEPLPKPTPQPTIDSS